jgi:hypothetical protein
VSCRAVAEALRAQANVLLVQASALDLDCDSSSHNDYLDQHSSPLGPRRHIALARNLIAQGDTRAMKVGRRWLVQPSALNDVNSASSAKHAETETAADRAARRLKGVAV